MGTEIARTLSPKLLKMNYKELLFTPRDSNSAFPHNKTDSHLLLPSTGCCCDAVCSSFFFFALGCLHTRVYVVVDYYKSVDFNGVLLQNIRKEKKVKKSDTLSRHLKKTYNCTAL